MSRPNWIGKTLNGRYKIQEILGQGGMSAVYKALDPNLQRVVAVKMIHSHLSEDPKFISRFEEEARSVAQLRHPNITQVFDFNHDSDTYYMVQEFIPGETLQERLRRLNRAGQRLPINEAIRITMDVCSAMGYAHERGMIHRDIKPANIMLDVQGRAILMDFGIVKIVGSTSHTTTGAVIGTAMYMSPDVIRGEVPDARSDIYSLGVTLFEMVSGHPPFQADSAMSLLMMHLHDPLPNLRELRSEIPSDLIAVIEKSLAKSKDERYQTTKEMWSGLKRVIDRLEGGASSISAQVVQAPGQISPHQAATRVEPSATILDSQAGKPSARPTSPPMVSQPQSPQSPPAKPVTGVAGPTRLEDSSPPSTLPVEGYPAGSPAAAEPHRPVKAPLPASAGARPAAPGQSATQTSASQKLVKPALLAGGGAMLVVIVLCLIAGGVAGGYLLNRSGFFAGATDTPTATSTATPPGNAIEPGFASATASPTANAPDTPTAPVVTPTPRFLPTVTVPAGIPFARINAIELGSERRYVVDYETFDYTEALPGQHVHFFFNTVPPDQAGSPGKGPWILYGGPRPFTGYAAVDRPENASQMCILVANPDHSVQSNSGNCFPLPDIPTAAMREDTVCRAGPGEVYATVAPINARTTLLVRGLSADENWWVIQNPQNLDESCWIPNSQVAIWGNISGVQVVEAPPTPAGAPEGQPTVEITGITVDSQNRYAVEFVTQNFTPQIPGVHIHFFFNTVSPDQVGLGGSGDRLMYGGTSPFTGYAVSDRPAQATQLCAVVVNPDHSVIPESGGCFALPATP